MTKGIHRVVAGTKAGRQMAAFVSRTSTTAANIDAKSRQEIESWNYRIDIENQAKKNAKKLKKHNSKEYPDGTQSKRTF